MFHINGFIILLSFIILSLGVTGKIHADNSVKPLQATNKEVTGQYVRKRFLALMNKSFDLSEKNKSQTKVLIIGDSHAQDFLNAIAENNLLKNSQIRTRYIPTRCQLFLGDHANREWLASDKKLCVKSDSLEQAKAQIMNADVIIFAALWRKWAAVQLSQTLKNLKLSANQTIFVIGRRSFLGLDKEMGAKFREVDVHQIEINDIMKASLDKRIFIDVHTLVCGTGSSCPVFTDREKLITVDGGHLSQDGAQYLGKLLFEKSALSQLKENLK